MAHFAELDENNIVLRVIVVETVQQATMRSGVGAD
jgi:hypothetical protein